MNTNMNKNEYMSDLLEVQYYLKGITVIDGKDPVFALNLLTEEYGIKVKQYDDRVVLNYSQIDSPKNHPIADECRGLILSYPDFNVLAKGYNRFYNLTENGYDGPTDWKEWQALEKCDGSLIQIYHDNTKWQITTRGTAFGESIMGGNTFKYLGKENVTYRSGVLATLEMTEDFFQKWADNVFKKDNTYCFEFIAPYNQIVKFYSKEMLVLHGIFNKHTAEFDHNDWYEWENDFAGESKEWENIRLIKKYSIESMIDLEKQLSELTDLDEGFVLVNCFPNGNGEPHRVKCKSTAYLIVHKIRGDNGKLSLKDAITLFLDDGGAEYLSYFPDDKPIIDKVAAAYVELVSDMVETYLQTVRIESQKDFALKVTQTPYSAIMFQCRAKEEVPVIAFADAKDSLKFKLIELYYSKLNGEL